MQVGNNAALEKAIGVVERTRNHTIGVQVLDYVNEEKDGSAKDEFRWVAGTLAGAGNAMMSRLHGPQNE